MSVVIDVESVSKKFRIHHSRPKTLRESMIRRMKGRIDAGRVLWAIKDVTFQLNRGQTLGVIGRNGAGKSTLLRLLCGIGRPTAGSIRTIGQVSGLLDLSSGFHSLMTGRENIRTVGILNGLSKRQMEKLEKQMIAFSELEDFIDEPVRTYSSGMHLRLAFSAAIHMNPDILVVDEVFAVGDLSFREKCIQLLEQFRRAGKTLILASHEMGQIERSCDDAIVLEEGTLQFRSSPDRAVEFYYDLLRRNAEVRAMKNSGEGKVEQPPVGRRLGTQEARISQVRFYDHQGCQNTNFVSGGEITIEMEVQFAKSLSDFGLAVAIFSEANVKCLEVHIQSIRKIVDSWKENSKFHCRLPHLHLLPGHYYANVGIYPTDWNCIYDYHWQMHPFRITGEFPNVAGVISVQPDWSAL